MALRWLNCSNKGGGLLIWFSKSTYAKDYSSPWVLRLKVAKYEVHVIQQPLGTMARNSCVVEVTFIFCFMNGDALKIYFNIIFNYNS